MNRLLILLTILSIFSSADFFKSEEKAALKYEKERAHYCTVFTNKVLAYKNNMRNDELASITFESYINRANIYCSKEEPKKVQKVQKMVLAEPKYIKDISREDERLCKVFQHKLENYKENMRKDALALTTLNSYKKRTHIFCSKETLEKKEKDVLIENQKLCNVFAQGPILCKKFDKNFNIIENDSLSKVTLTSFKKREKVFCSSKPLKKKDLEVYAEHKRLCGLFNDKIIAYQKNMRDDSLALATLVSYKKRALYFCDTNNPSKNK